MIAFDSVTVRFNDRVLIRDFSFEALKGNKIVFRGKSGIGKTTLFRLILGFEQPDTGAVLYKGKTLNKDLVWEIRKKVAYVSQDLDIGEGAVREVLDRSFCYKANSHLPPGDEELFSLLDYFELDETILKENFPGISGGEKQRISIINAVLLKRDIFLLDEITSALDNSLKKKVIDFFLDNGDWTVLSISHDSGWINDGVRVIPLESE